MINPLIFREYDIRGVVDKDLTDETVDKIARGFATYIQQKELRTVALGGDCRLSSDRFRKVVSDALVASGCDVIDVGTVPTSLLYFAIEHLKAEAGIMITASHNPPEFNGFKLCVGSSSIYGKEIQKVREVIEEGNFTTGNGSYKIYENIINDYKNYLLKDLKLKRSLKVVVDSGNGTAGPVAPSLYRSLGCEVISLYEEMDGHFPNHHPDPTVPDNLKDLIKTVRDENADIGIGFDGDGDRIGVVDEQGKIIWGDHLLILFARDILKKYPGVTIISEVKASKNLYDDIKRHGGTPLMWKTGHSLIKQRMKETGALLGGEMSGHMFFRDRYFGFDDAIYAGGRLLELLSKQEKPLSKLLADVPKVYNTPEIRVPCADEQKFEVVEKIKNHFAKLNYDIIDIDGMRITFDDGWALVRASNTQPVLVLRFEATSEKRLQEIQEMIMAEVKKFTS
jgi:phosphomannomutase/phosphoglucomutase